MSINYKQLQELVKEAMFTGGGINEPSAPEGIPHRMPAADTAGSEENMGDSKANKLYEMALAAREATEKLVEALDEPIYDSAYEDAFKASACMRRVLNSLEESGAHPMPDQRVVPPTATMQKYGSFVPPETHGAYFGNSAGLGMVEAQEVVSTGPSLNDIYSQFIKDFRKLSPVSQNAHAGIERDSAQDIASGAEGGTLEPQERALIVLVQQFITDVGETNGDIAQARGAFERFFKQLLIQVEKSEKSMETK